MIEDLLRKNLHPQEIVDQLIIAALKGGGSDNITVILLEACD
jgi:serine/threonine protein phosphatase PrpC